MTKHADVIRYRHMLDYAKEAVSLSRGRMREDLDTDRTLNLSLTRLLEIIGEAASRVSKEERSNHPEIPWSQVVSMRNRLIHGYDSVDFDILWQIVTSDLPPLIVALESIL
ncbi:DUF86 domain-containing protein [Candidatus Poribacteria bacterium]|nr:DUF86 domain-containing protein [Candidatus Poribacteria bacterium]